MPYVIIDGPCDPQHTASQQLQWSSAVDKQLHVLHLLIVQNNSPA